MFAKISLLGLDQQRVVGVVVPVLRAHGVLGVELLWRTDSRGRVLYLTVERPDSRQPGAGITLELCSEISRDLSAALDVAQVIDASYRLEVGSPGLERALYTLSDYERFAGQLAKLKLNSPLEGQKTLRGTLQGTDASNQVLIDTDFGQFALQFDSIESGQLVFDWRARNMTHGKTNHGSRNHGGSGRARATSRTNGVHTNSGKPRKQRNR